MMIVRIMMMMRMMPTVMTKLVSCDVYRQ